jgi:hypothetical protein
MAANWRDVAEKVRNWGKWGPNDQLGTLNYITPEKIARASAMVRQGKVFPLSIPVDSYGLGRTGSAVIPFHYVRGRWR